jgi:CTP:molybdopterin cytidylyltransferase MocA
LVSAVVLAAGFGRRFGPDGRKLLTPWRGRSLIEHVLATVVSARNEGLIGSGLVVHGPNPRGDEIRDLASSSGLDAVLVEKPERGLSESLQAGFTILEASAPPHRQTAALVFLGDQPAVALGTIRALVEKASPFALVRPRYRDQPDAPGHPVLIGRAHWGLVGETSGDRGLDPVIEAHALAWDLVEVEGRSPDIDIMADLESLGREPE